MKTPHISHTFNQAKTNNMQTHKNTLIIVNDTHTHRKTQARKIIQTFLREKKPRYVVVCVRYIIVHNFLLHCSSGASL